MRMVDLIEMKKNKGEFNEHQIQFLIDGYVRGDIPDYQVSALLMAIYFTGMTVQETVLLTKVMANSGEVMDFSTIKGVVTDKHSTGGVGDKTTLIIAPMVAACGGKIAKMSGRGLGHTGGTLDKLESIPGFNVFKNSKEIIDQVNTIGIALVGQTEDLVPADKKLYALRDVTGTVSCMPLIASSIMSKKIASGAKTILLDVKYGQGAFMKTREEAVQLANMMIEIGRKCHKDTRAIISDMNQPLGNTIGNTLEVIEAIETLQDNGPADLKQLCLEIASEMLLQSKLYDRKEKAVSVLKKVLENGEAFTKFKEVVKAQGGDVSYIENPERFKLGNVMIKLTSRKTGYIRLLNAKALGLAVMKLGGGRLHKDDVIDHEAGIVLHKKTGDLVQKDEVLMDVYANKNIDQEIVNQLYEAVDIVDYKVEKPVYVEEILK